MRRPWRVSGSAALVMMRSMLMMKPEEAVPPTTACATHVVHMHADEEGECIECVVRGRQRVVGGAALGWGGKAPIHVCCMHPGAGELAQVS